MAKKSAARKVRPIDAPSQSVSSQYVKVGNGCVRISIHVKAQCRDRKPGRSAQKPLASMRSGGESSGIQPMSDNGPGGSTGGGGGGVQPMVSIDITVEANDP